MFYGGVHAIQYLKSVFKSRKKKKEKEKREKNPSTSKDQQSSICEVNIILKHIFAIGS
jgi:hypothetical protein